jgi:uncharacterized protein (TIGR03437 family)
MFNKSDSLYLIALCIAALPAAAAQQAPVALGSNSTFAILAGTTVTITGGGTITGNIGINPGTAYVPGNPAVTINGTLYAGGPVAAQAQADLTLAFNDAAGRQAPAVVAGNIGGQTLAPGLYKSTSSLAISSGDLTLDAQGNPNAVFIFQIASTLTVTSGRQVILAGGANAANIFWQVGSSATLGTTSVVYGNILAAVSISTLTGSTLHGRALAQGGAVSVDTGGGSSVTLPAATALPTVTSTAPLSSATAVPVGNKLSATFSEAMDPTTINTSTFALARAGVAVTGIVTYTGTTATFAPASPLLPLTLYTASVTTGAKDPAGNALAATYVWSFTTGAALSTTPPTVISTAPANAASGVPFANKLSATFSEAMDPATLTAVTFTLQQGATVIPGSVSYSGTSATFTPAGALVPLTVYTATITTGAKDLAGNALAANYPWIFTTGTTANTTPPTVISTSPANASSGASISNPITATFSESLDPLTITTASMSMQQGPTAVAGGVTYSGVTAVLTPAAALAPATTYTVTLTTAVKDLAGNSLGAPFTWVFTTAATATPPPAILPTGTVNNSTATVNDASYVTPVAAGSIAAVFGTNLSIGQSSSLLPTPLPFTVAQTSFLIGGVQTPIYFASPGQVNVQIPWEMAGQTSVSIRATVGGVASNGQLVNIAPFSPGIFSMDATGSGQGAVLVAPTAQLAAPGTPALRGGYVSIFCTGLGAVTDPPATGASALAVPLSFSLTLPTVTIGGTQAIVTYSGLAPGLVGLYQVNAIVPAGITPGNAVSVVLAIGGLISNGVTIAVQ